MHGQRWARIVTLGTLMAALAAGVATVRAQDGSASDNTVAPSLVGGCTASGTIDGYGTVDPASSGGVYTVPKSGSASYAGSVPAQGEDRPNHGEVGVELPLGLPRLTIKSWSDEDSDRTADSGVVTWDIPSIVPGNIEMTVSGYHQDVGVRCEGRVVVKLDGGGLGSPLGLGSLAATALALVGLAWAATPTSRGF